MQTKKHLILCVLNILNNESSEEHPITQKEITSLISSVYPCDRKTVCRNIGFLTEMGYPIKKTTNGFYMDKKVFSPEEAKFVKEAILSAGGKNDEEKAKIADKVVYMMSKMMRR